MWPLKGAAPSCSGGESDTELDVLYEPEGALRGTFKSLYWSPAIRLGVCLAAIGNGSELGAAGAKQFDRRLLTQKPGDHARNAGSANSLSCIANRLQEFEMDRESMRGEADKAKREKEAVDKVIRDKKKESIGTKDAEEKVASDLNEAAQQDTKKD